MSDESTATIVASVTNDEESYVITEKDGVRFFYYTRITVDGISGVKSNTPNLMIKFKDEDVFGYSEEEEEWEERVPEDSPRTIREEGIVDATGWLRRIPRVLRSLRT